MRLESHLCNFGWKAPDFQLKDPEGNSFNLHALKRENGLLIAFICNHCPYVKAIIERFVDDAHTLLHEGVGVVAVMPNNYKRYPEDAPDRMTAFARQHGFQFPYLVDDTQEVARAYKAVCTPDFFGFNRDLELQYRGRIDDAKMGGASQRTPELLHAMRQVVETGKGPLTQSASMGCSIKWKI